MCSNTIRWLWLQIREETDIGQTLGCLASTSEYESGYLELNLWGFRDKRCEVEAGLLSKARPWLGSAFAQ